MPILVPTDPVAEIQSKPPDLYLNGIPAYVSYANQSYLKSNGEQGPRREIEYIVAWADSDNFIDALVMSVSTVGGQVQYKLPHAYPGNSNIWCLEAQGTILGAMSPDPQKLVGGPLCLVKAVYGRPRFEISGEGLPSFLGQYARPFMRCHFDSDIASEPLDQSSLRIEADAGPGPPGTPDSTAEPLSKAFPLEYPTGNLMIEYQMMPFAPPISSLLLLNSLNQSTFLGFAAGTLKFSKLTFEDDFAPDGTLTYNWTMGFEWKPWDHNTKWLRDDTGRGTVASATGLTPYAYADLTQVLVGASGY